MVNTPMEQTKPADIELRFVKSTDGVEVPLRYAGSPNPRWALLFMPALGIRASLYDRFAVDLANNGVACLVLEQRGHGDSPLRASRAVNWSFDDQLEQDIPAAVAELRSLTGRLPLVVGGHSIGGHFATVLAGRQPTLMDGLLHVACGFPYHRDYPGRQGALLRRLLGLLPLLAVVPGYYPGQRLGFGGRESLRFMRDWATWARSGSFDFADRTGVAEAVAAYRGPVLSITLDADRFVTDKSHRRALSPLVNADVEEVVLTEAEQGKHRGHASWAKEPRGVTTATLAWLRRKDLLCAEIAPS